MELAPAPVSFSEGVLVLQSPPRTPPGAEDEQALEGPALVDVVLEDLHAPARRPTAQTIAPKLTRRRRCIGFLMAAWCKGLLLSSRWIPRAAGAQKGPQPPPPLRRGPYIIRAVDIVEIMESRVNRPTYGPVLSTCQGCAPVVPYF